MSVLDPTQTKRQRQAVEMQDFSAVILVGNGEK
jgi:hypothetical protein